MSRTTAVVAAFALALGFIAPQASEATAQTAAVAAADQPAPSGRYDNKAPEVRYSGTWETLGADTRDYGGDVVRTRTTGDWAQLTFNSTGVRWLARTGPYFGIAQVYIDNQPVATVDLYSVSTQYQQTVYETTNLSAGNHTIRIERIGKKNASSPTSDILLDGFDVLDKIAPTSVTNLTAASRSSVVDLSWAANTEGDLSHYSISKKVGDSSSQDLLDIEKGTTNYTDANVTPGTNIVYTVRAVDTSGNQSSPSTVNFNAPLGRVAASGRYDNKSPEVQYSGTWETLGADTRDYGGDVVRTRTTGDWAQLTFNSTGVRWLARTGPYFGIAQVYIDNQPVATVDLYSVSTQYQQTVYETTNLSAGNHTIRIERIGKKNASSPTSDILLDGFDVLDKIAPTSVTNLTGSDNRLGSQLSWSAPEQQDMRRFDISRRTPGGQWAIVGSADPSKRSYIDIEAPYNGNYQYRVESVDWSGNRSIGASQPTITRGATPGSMSRSSQCPTTGATTVRTATELQSALQTANPGGVIRLAPGTYQGYFLMQRSGTLSSPIWICGSSDTILTRGSTSAGFAVHLEGVHDVILTGMTIRNATQAVALSGSTRVTVSDLRISNTGQEAIKLRYNTTNSRIGWNSIDGTGKVEAEYGEGIYVGTSPARWCEYTNCQPDASDGNFIVRNTIKNTTADPIEVKQGSKNGVIIANTLDGAGLRAAGVTSLIFVKGNGWLVRDNVGTNSPSSAFAANIDYAPQPDWGKSNVFVGNRATSPDSTRPLVAVRENVGNRVGCSNKPGSGQPISNIACG
ncbi:right-handed parallel beta-helix repeat-containing protein [Microbacterium hydrothermale]|uniref:right-handed parallel beta-helix repeat-containing protein n=1 Tax=Microbacterium hydrothermale TaxID=857427 RepID=UPI0010A91C43|nr:right-handed parallel beta-helix repeat-containing protein [Microbacterium hydrothermale]